MRKEADNYHMNKLDEVNFIYCTREVWEAESGEGLSSFTVSYLSNEWTIWTNTLGSSVQNESHTGKVVSEVFTKAVSKLKLDRKVIFYYRQAVHDKEANKII